MVTDALGQEGTLNDDVLRRIRETGLFKEVLTMEPVESPRAPVFVRPDSGEGGQDWTARVEQVLALAPGARVGVGAEDAALAASAAVWLAVSVADAGRRVVVVDGSVRTPVIAKALEGDGDEGLVDSVMFGVSTAVTARRTLAAGVSLMNSGSVPVSAEEVFRSDNFEATLRGFAQDVIVFIALPAGFLAAAAHALTDVVLLGRGAAELESAARSAADAPGPGPSRTVGLLVSRARPRRPPGLVETIPESDAPAPQEPVVEKPAPVTVKAPERVPEPTPVDAPPAAERQQPRRSRVRTAYRTPAPAAERRTRRVRPVVLSVVAIVIVAAMAAWQSGALDPLFGTGKPARTGGVAPHPSAVQPPRTAAVGESAGSDEADTRSSPSGDVGTLPDATGALPAPVGVATEAEPEDRAPTRVSGPGGRYVIYVSSHRSETAADADAASLAGFGVASAVARAEVGGSGTWYRVRVAGGYPTLQAAQQALEVVKGLSYVGAWIERTPESH